MLKIQNEAERQLPLPPSTSRRRQRKRDQVRTMTYFFPLWYVFPLKTSLLQLQEPAKETAFESLQSNTSTLSSVEKEKWQKYLEIFRGYLERKSKRLGKKLWSKEEDELLGELNSRGFSWDEISKIIPQTNSKICKRRFERLNQILSKWPKELDNMIKSLVESQQENWGKIHEILYCKSGLNLPKHSVKELKERYLLNLRPGIMFEEWSTEEDIALLNIIKQKGTQWRKLSKLFNGRTQLQLKNRFYGTLKPLEKKVLRKLNLNMKQTLHKTNISL